MSWTLLALSLVAFAQDKGGESPASEEEPPVEESAEAADEDEDAPSEGADAPPDDPAEGEEPGGEEDDNESADEDGSEDTEQAGSFTEDPAETEEEPASPEERLEDVEARLAAQQAELERMNQQLAETRLKLIPPDKFTVKMEGYYRTRAYIFPNLFNPVKEGKDARYMEHRLRLRPIFSYRELAKLGLQVNGLEDVVWGDNESLAQTSIFANNPTSTDIEGQPAPTFYLSRAWMEFNVPVGLLRVGRMGSHWGMGLLANDGNGFRNDFGEARNGNTFDRAIFATKPIAIAQAIMGKEGKDIPFFLAVGVDRLVEDPLVQYYGFKCEEGIYEGEDGYEERCDTDGDGRTEGHDYTEDTRQPENRGQDWWADQDDDVIEMIYAAIYRGEDIDLLGTTGDLTAGGYVIHRVQRETDSNVVVGDVYLKSNVYGVRLEFEGLTIQGKTRGVVLPGAIPEEGTDPLLKTADIWSYVGRLGYGTADWLLMMEHGYASGDQNIADDSFTNRPIHPDHNVGLLLYEEILARASAQSYGEGGRPLWSQGGVYASRYIFPTARYFPLDNWEIIGGFLMAWPDRPNGNVIQCREGEGCETANATASALGWEADIGIHHTFHKHIRFALESGYCHATDRFALEASGLNPKGNFFTLQSRIAYQF